MIPQDTDPLRAKGTDREPADSIVLSEKDYAALQSMGFRKDPEGRYLLPHEQYPGWSVPRPWYRRLAAWVRRGLR